jgi:ubiquinone/menaquinone biosynthesis C-methylase UbiE
LNATGTIVLTNFSISAAGPDHQFEENYLNVRRKESRVYNDEQVYALPEMEKEHPHHAEWRLRSASSQRLIKYLKTKSPNPQILEIGCGNGWLTNQLSQIPGSKIIGSDINLTELQQASRVFANNPQVKFIYGDIRSGMLNDRFFDFIVFAASIQYFSSLPEILSLSLQRLLPGGEIHILDSHLYRLSALARARKGTEVYYHALGFPEMISFYHHHTMRDLRFFKYRILASPGSIKNILFRRTPFPWVCIKNR